MMYQVTLHDRGLDEIRIADVQADGEDEAMKAARRQYPATAFNVLRVDVVRNPSALARHPLKARKPKQTELFS